MVVTVLRWIATGLMSLLALGALASFGLFIAFVGFRNAGIIVPSAATTVTNFGTGVKSHPMANTEPSVMIVKCTRRAGGQFNPACSIKFASFGPS